MKALRTLTAAERKAMKAEINRQLLEMDAAHADNLDIVILYTLRARFGFGKTRLRRFYEAFYEEREELIKYYEMPDDVVWLCERELLKIGVDVRAWNKEGRG